MSFSAMDHSSRAIIVWVKLFSKKVPAYSIYVKHQPFLQYLKVHQRIPNLHPLHLPPLPKNMKVSATRFPAFSLVAALLLQHLHPNQMRHQHHPHLAVWSFY
jgi:hypothetical protein